MRKYILSFLFIWAALYSVAQIPSPLPNTYVNDLTGSLSKEQIYTLNDSILSLEKKSGVQIAIVLVNTLPPDMEIEDYARAIGKKWGVGNTKNGIVYVAAIQQRKQRLEIAENLEGDIPDITALAITDDVKPYFRNKDYFGGLANMIANITEKVDPVAKEQKALLIKKNQAKADEFAADGKKIILFLIVFLTIGGIIGYIVYLKYEKKRKEEEAQANKLMEIDRQRRIQSLARLPQPKRNPYPPRPKTTSVKQGTVVTPVIVPIVVPDPPKRKSDDDDNYRSSSSSSSSSSSDNSSSFGSWGSDSSSSGFSGGGSSNDW